LTVNGASLFTKDITVNTDIIMGASGAARIYGSNKSKDLCIYFDSN
jgi:hypothetical protein